LGLTAMRNRPMTNEELGKQILYGIALIATSCVAIWLLGFAFNPDQIRSLSDVANR
jgi:hypothetical protein